MPGTIAVQGLRDLQRAFKAADAATALELRKTLRDIGEPIRLDAERLAVERIPRIGVPWSQMRVGVTTNLVYVTSKQRGRKSRTNPRLRRPNLADLLLGRSMEPALAENTHGTEVRFNRLLDTVARVWEEA